MNGNVFIVNIKSPLLSSKSNIELKEGGDVTTNNKKNIKFAVSNALQKSNNKFLNT